MNDTILLVDDEDSVITYLEKELQYEGYQVLVAQDGEAAVTTYEAHVTDISLIILDWMLPKLDGLEVMRRVRRQAAVPIIMMTARDYVGDKVSGLDAGADDYITKPFDIEELLARIRVILRRKSMPTVHDSYAVGDLQIDTRTRQVMYGSTKVQLTQREFELLLTLVAANGEAMTRDELLDHVWGVDFDGQINIVDVYIRFVRNKFKDAVGDDSADFIETIRGVGYRIDESKLNKSATNK
ncbi:response regulator transcription factor [Secundilactobacillus kimchicus]|uniref:Winged helix family two component transcriptional regulator n=1 Tax=Secundilactobacillus kimchicus JCM 15530 TaxID=1302272 RepID=A0A0R1HL37_9LACO|nr:response regulator transcription factor [Secundilactobacillus kimchicus]KRK47083.1 winged helix family two component transcriptional regulator [Secundilactobacillus kimchicus JCM 15530]